MQTRRDARSRAVIVAAVVACASCAGAAPGDSSLVDGGATLDLAGARFDLSSSPDLACALGTPNACSSCTDVCPASDDATTARTCASATCGIECKGDYYDVNGMASDGCEILDVSQSSAATAMAITLADAAPAGGMCSGTNNGCTVVEAIASDSRTHDSAPATRPLGLMDWWKVTAVGTGGSNPMKACLSISDATWPSDNQYQLCISTTTSMTPTVCATAVARMASVCVQPTGSTDAGTYYITVGKTVGMPTALGYALYLEH